LRTKAFLFLLPVVALLVVPLAHAQQQPTCPAGYKLSVNGTCVLTLLCDPAVCDNSQFKEFAFDYDIDLLNIHIHKHSGIWHNERGVFVPWSALCNQGQGYLVQSCSNLIDSNGTLRQAGDKAVGCITNGAIITIAANTVHLPLDIVTSALRAIAPMTGCDGIVNLDTIQTGPQLQSLLTALSNAAGQKKMNSECERQISHAVRCVGQSVTPLMKNAWF
jgi:hypothetical protein